MHRTDAADNVSGQFTDGVPGTTPATVIDDAWLNDVQENLCQAVEAAGITLVKGTYTQLAAAVRTFNGDTDETIAARHSDTVPTTRRCIDKWNLGETPNVYGRLYAAVGGLEFTVNASWNGTNWVADKTTVPAKRLSLPIGGARGQGGIYGDLAADVKSDTSAAWANTAWDIYTATSAVTYGTNVTGGVDDLSRSPDGGVRVAARITFSGVIAADTTIATLPNGFRPGQPVLVVGTAGTDATHFDGAFVRVKINTDGTVTLGSATANVGSAGGSLAFSAAFTGA